jgi:hypothetical protein
VSSASSTGPPSNITAKKLADAQVAEHLVAAVTARAEAESAETEAEALRKATLALTENLRMNAVLDTRLVSNPLSTNVNWSAMIHEGRLPDKRRRVSRPSDRFGGIDQGSQILQQSL